MFRSVVYVLLFSVRCIVAIDYINSAFSDGSDFILATFDNNGIVQAKNVSLVGDIAMLGTINSFVVQPDNKIIAVGQSFASSESEHTQFMIARFHPDGSLDRSFNASGVSSGVPGVIFIDFSCNENTVNSVAHAVTLALDGRIVIVGAAQDAARITRTKEYFYAAAVMHSDGSLDKTFADGAGKVIIGLDDVPIYECSMGCAVAIQKMDARDYIIIAGGAKGNKPFFEYQIIRLAFDGKLDLAFGSNGFDSLDFGGIGEEIAADLAIYPDGKILVVGTSEGNENGDNVIAIARRLPNGGGDLDFNMVGMAIAHIPGIQLNGRLVHIQANQNILIIGQQQSGEDLVVHFDDRGNVKQPTKDFSYLKKRAALDENLCAKNKKIICIAHKSDTANALVDASCVSLGLRAQSCISEAIREKYCPSFIDLPLDN